MGAAAAACLEPPACGPSGAAAAQWVRALALTMIYHYNSILCYFHYMFEYRRTCFIYVTIAQFDFLQIDQKSIIRVDHMQIPWQCIPYPVSVLVASSPPYHHNRPSYYLLTYHHTLPPPPDLFLIPSLLHLPQCIAVRRPARFPA